MPNTELVPADDPNRCTGSIPSGQCTSRSLPGTDKCAAHGGTRASNSYQRRQYLITEARAQQRVNELASHEAIYSLRDEIAITRLLVQEQLDKRDAEAMLAVPALVQLFTVLEKLIKTSSNIEVKLGNMLSKDTLMRVASQIIEIINDELKDLPDYEERVDQITMRIAAEVSASKNQDPDNEQE
ncbi:MAG: hypothetical protein ACTHK7_15965 [Aureliella sp.]